MAIISDIFKKHSSELLMSAYYLLKDMDDAEDAVSACFEKLLKNEAVLNREEEEIKAWLLVVIKNYCLDYLKTGSNRKKIISLLNFDNLTNNYWYEKVEKDNLDKLLQLLTSKEAEVFKLHFDGYTNEEIATKIGVSYSTIKNQLYDAKKKLRKLWAIMGCLIVLIIIG
jgi:RNA polymerase sigma-70 factor (ECF subfamily)